MRHDVMKLDRELVALRQRRRAAIAALGTQTEVPSPFHSPLFRLHEELAESDDPVARHVAEWLDVMVVERGTWDDRATLEALWDEPHRVHAIDEPISLRQLRARLLAATPRARAVFEDGMCAVADEASARAIGTLVWRLEREGDAYFAVDGSDVGAGLGDRVLAATYDMAVDVSEGLLATAQRAMGAAATEGWPARLSTRWLADVFSGTGLGAGLNLKVGALPHPLGAMSFARALGALGTAVLDAGRPKSMPFSMHKRPRGHRRHARRALFASVVLERPFAKRVLGMGSDRVRDHRRHVAEAIALSLRFDALRVVLTTAIAHGAGAGRDIFSEVTDRHFGSAAPSNLLAVLPRLRPADAPALVGAVLAFSTRARLVEEHDEDWFRNPRAVEQLRHENAAPAPPAPSAEDVAHGLACLKATLEEAAS